MTNINIDDILRERDSLEKSSVAGLEAMLHIAREIAEGGGQEDMEYFIMLIEDVLIEKLSEPG